MATITTRVGKGSKLTVEEMDANFTNLNEKKAELGEGNKVSPNNLPDVYWSGVTGSGTEADPYIAGGFSEEQLITWLQSRPGFASDNVFKGDLQWHVLTDSTLEKLATPVISFGTSTGDSIPVNWTAVPNGATNTLERASSVSFSDPLVLYSGPLLTYTAVGLEPLTTYFFRVKATASGFNGSNYATGSKATDVAGNVTPVAPTIVADDNADTLTISHTRGESEILVSVNDGTYVALTAVAGWNATTHKIDVGNVARALGYYKTKTKAATGFNESPVASSPAFTVALSTPSAPTTPVNDNSGRTFGFTNTGGKTNADTEITLNSGTSVTSNSANPFPVGDNALAIGQVGVRYKAVPGVNNASAWLFNTVAFTAAPQTTVALTSWRTPIQNGTSTGNSFVFTTPSGQGFGGAKGNYMIPGGGTGWVEFTADTALNGAIILNTGIDTFGDRNGSGTASPLALDYASNRFQTWVAGNDNFANPRPAFSSNTKGRIRLDGTNAYFECSSDAGSTWQLMRTTTQPQVDLYVKVWSNINQTNTPVNNIRGFNLTLVS